MSRLTVCGAAEHRPVQLFERATRIAEIGSQPVEQGLIGGQFAGPPQVMRGCRQGLAEVPAPEMVDRHTRCQGIFRIGDPPGQGGTPAGAGLGVLWS